jgi:hypothetical protein
MRSASRRAEIISVSPSRIKLGKPEYTEEHGTGFVGGQAEVNKALTQ